MTDIPNQPRGRDLHASLWIHSFILCLFIELKNITAPSMHVQNMNWILCHNSVALPLFIWTVIVLELRADGTRVVDNCFFLSWQQLFFCFLLQNTIRWWEVLNVKHYVVLCFSCRWRKWATPQAQEGSLLKSELVTAFIEWRCLKCVCVCVCWETRWSFLTCPHVLLFWWADCFVKGNAKG